MKRIIIFTLAIFTAIISSCKVDSAEPIRDITYRGQCIFEITSGKGISPYLVGIDNVLKAEEVVNASAEKRDSLEDLYFPEYKIRSNEDCIYIKDYAYIYKTNNIPISEVGAVRNYISQEFQMSIICVGSGIYDLTSATISPLEPNTIIQAQVSRFFSQNWAYPSSIYSYQLSGYGLYSEFVDSWYVYYDDYSESGKNSHYDVNYSFDSSNPLKAIRIGTNDVFRFISGHLHMEVSGTALGNEIDEVDATLYYDGNDGNVNYVVSTIHYRGETRKWNM